MDAARGNGAGRDAAAGHTVVVIPTLDEEQSIAEVVRSIPRTIASRPPPSRRPPPSSNMQTPRSPGCSDLENVGSQFLSLRQFVHVQHSPLACEPAEIPNKHGPPRANLRTATHQPGPKILSLRPVFLQSSGLREFSTDPTRY